MKHSVARPVSFLAVIVFTLVGLTFGWVNAASAGELFDCVSRPLQNGRPGETVKVCKVKPSTQRVGVTTVVHYGR